MRWFHKAAELGNVTAQLTLAHIYKNGEGVPRDDKEAARWFRKAAEQGDPNAQEHLAPKP